jgi:hypothetical protein
LGFPIVACSFYSVVLFNIPYLVYYWLICAALY